MAAPVLQFKRGLLTNLPGLRAGEPGFTTDSYDFYVGLTSETSTNKFFGSHRYWIKETTSTGSAVNLVEGTSNGSDYISIKSPDSLAGIVTYVLPGTQGNSSTVLTNDGSGNLSWAGGSANPVFTGIATFSDTTDNTLGDSDTGSVQIDGGLGIDKNTTVGANLNVQGYSEFVGVSTFGSDLDVNASADISTDLSVGQNLSVTGVSTFTGAIDANGGADISGGETILSSATVSDLTSGRVVLAGISGALEDSGNLTFNGSTLTVVGYADLDDVNVSSALSAPTISVTNIKAADDTAGLTIANSTGAVTASHNLIVQGNLYINGSTTQVNTTSLTVEDTLVELGLVDGSLPTTDVNRDLGIIFNYYTVSAKKAAVYWDDSTSRIALAAEVSESSSVLTASTYAPIEVGALWVNDCAGQSQVISCTGSERFLENITIDCGTF